jgi:hypothetical protein
MREPRARNPAKCKRCGMTLERVTRSHVRSVTEAILKRLEEIPVEVKAQESSETAPFVTIGRLTGVVEFHVSHLHGLTIGVCGYCVDKERDAVREKERSEKE